MYMVGAASQLKVVQCVRSAVGEWDPVVNLEAVGSAADHAGLVALVDEGSESAPVPAAPDLPPLFPGALPIL